MRDPRPGAADANLWLLDDEHVPGSPAHPKGTRQRLGKKEQVLLDVAVFPWQGVPVALGDGLIGVDIADATDTTLVGVDVAGDQGEDEGVGVDRFSISLK